MKRITIYDVAKEADVSLATVSRVINDSNVVREDTRMRVQQAIEKLGYKPNAIAQGLALSKTTTISIVMSEKLFAYNAKILNGLQQRLLELGRDAGGQSGHLWGTVCCIFRRV